MKIYFYFIIIFIIYEPIFLHVAMSLVHLLLEKHTRNKHTKYCAKFNEKINCPLIILG